MTDPLKLNVSLLCLRVSLAPGDTAQAQDVILELQIGGNPAERDVTSYDALSNAAATPGDPTSTGPMTTTSEAAPLGSWRVSAQDLGLPASLADALKFSDTPQPILRMVLAGIDALVSRFFAEYRSGWVSSFSSAVQIPPPVQRAIKVLLARLHRPDDPLWLEFGTPSGYLPLLPWEVMLRAVVDQPILRLPYHALQPILRRETLQVVVCISTPGSSRLSVKTLLPLLQEIAKALPRGSLVDVFGDDHAFAILAPLQLSANPSSARIALHPPETARQAREAQVKAETGPRDAVTRPWTVWIHDRLKGRGVDILHVVAAGMPVPGSPALVFGMTPDRGERAGSTRDPVRLLGASMLHDLAVELGASSIICTSPGGALSKLALRVFIDQLAKLRPGVRALHDLDDDAQSAALGAMYRFLFGADRAPASRGDGIALYCHPAHVGFAAVDDERPLLRAFRDFAQQTLAGQPAEGPPPRWVASSQRYLEETVSQCLATPPRNELEHAAVDGVEEALKTISRAFQHGSGVSESPPRPPAAPTSGA